MLKFSNFGKAILASAPSGTTGLAFTVEAGKGLLFPSLGVGDYFYGILKDASGNREVVKVEARSTDGMTIAVGGRGLDGSTARTWAAGDYFVAGLVNVALTESLSNTALTAVGTVTPAADKLPYFTGSTTAAVTPFTAAARALLDDADAAAMLTTLGISAYIQTLLDDADAATARATLAALGTAGGTMTGDIVMSSKAVQFGRVALAAHATTMNIWQANFIDVTGATPVTVTDFADAPQGGCEAELYCAAAHTFTSNANILIAGGSVAVAIGERVRVRALSTTVFVLEKIFPYATIAEAQAGTLASKFVTPESLNFTVLGMGQTWQNKTAERAALTGYTNPTVRPILVTISMTINSSNATASLTINGVVTVISSATHTSGTRVSIQSALIPAGGTYSIAPSAGTITIGTWMELR
jgi:hypothetical protein